MLTRAARSTGLSRGNAVAVYVMLPSLCAFPRRRGTKDGDASVLQPLARLIDALLVLACARPLTHQSGFPERLHKI